MERLGFRIEFIDEEAYEEFRALPKSAQLLLGKAIKERLETNPLLYGKPLRYSYIGHRRLRVSKYRIIYRIEEKKRIVIIVKIDLRKDVYEE